MANEEPAVEASTAAAILQATANGDCDAARSMDKIIYDRLRVIAGGLMGRERMNHTLQPTALVNEAYMRLIDQRNARVEDRTAFLGIAANIMRRILVDHARGKGRVKRGGGAAAGALDAVTVADPQHPGSGVALLDLDNALEALKALDERQAQIVELKFFAEMTNDQVAQYLNVSPRTVEGDWSMARAWLRRRLTSNSSTI